MKMTINETPKRNVFAQAENSLDLVARYCSDMSRDYPTRISYYRVGEALTCLDKFIKKQERNRSQPTLSECIKEWESRGFIVSNHDKHIVIKLTDEAIDGFIHISKRFKKVYIRCVLSYDLVHLLSKTLKSLEVENGKEI